MVARKLRLHAVLDTNVLLGHFLTTNRRSPNARVFRLWLPRRHVQLIVSDGVIDEYLRMFAEKLDMRPKQLGAWRERFENDPHCTLVTPGPRPKLSRDPDDNIFIATAVAGRAEYLITNDRDLLELPEDFRRKIPFAIVTPRQFLALFAD
jgi:putative PIN family toxin of toxin-antitoxin system